MDLFENHKFNRASPVSSTPPPRDLGQDPRQVALSVLSRSTKTKNCRFPTHFKACFDAAKRFFRKMLKDEPLLSPQKIGMLISASN